jgi:hypothetical protein
MSHEFNFFTISGIGVGRNDYGYFLSVV